MPEDKLPATHTARVLWDVIGALDLTAFLDGVKAIEGTVGRKTRSPQMKLTRWLYAISNGVGSAREIARLIGSDDGSRWIVGDLEVGHHTMSAFRVNHGAALEQLRRRRPTSTSNRRAHEPRAKAPRPFVRHVLSRDNATS